MYFLINSTDQDFSQEKAEESNRLASNSWKPSALWLTADYKAASVD